MQSQPLQPSLFSSVPALPCPALPSPHRRAARPAARPAASPLAPSLRPLHHQDPNPQPSLALPSPCSHHNQSSSTRDCASKMTAPEPHYCESDSDSASTTFTTSATPTKLPLHYTTTSTPSTPSTPSTAKPAACSTRLINDSLPLILARFLPSTPA